MSSLFRDWIIDPVALLFLFSLVLLLALSFTARRRSHGGEQPSATTRLSLWPWLLLSLWLGLFLVSSAPVIVNPLVALLEDPYLEGSACEVGSHLVVLGGGLDSRAREIREYERMSAASLSRAAAAARLLLREEERQTQVIVAGGAVRQIAEAQVIAAYLQQLDVEGERITLETASSSTRENALNVADLLADASEQGQVQGPVRLLTSAMHMPRALNTFRKVLATTGIAVCPVSVDVQALKNVPAYALMPQSTALARFDLLLHETVALLLYRVKGWI